MHSSDRTLLASLGFQDRDRRDRRHTLACQYLAQPEVLAKICAHLAGPFTRSEDLAVAEALQLAAVDAAPLPLAAFAQWEREHPAGNLETTTGTRRYNPRRRADLTFSPGKIECAIRRGGGFLVGFWDVVAVGAYRVARVAVRDTYSRGVAPPQQPQCPAILDRWVENPGEEETREREEAREAYARAMDASREAERRWGALPVVHQGRTSTIEWEERTTKLCIEVKAAEVDVAEAARQVELYAGETMPPPTHHTALVLATLYPVSALDKATLAEKAIHHIFLGDPFSAWVAAQDNATTTELGF